MTRLNVRLLRLGRHFRFPSGAKAIVGRDEKDNGRIDAAAREGDCVILPTEAAGPTVLLTKPFDDDDVGFAAKLCASFSDNAGEAIEIEIRHPSGSRLLPVTPGPRAAFDEMRI